MKRFCVMSLALWVCLFALPFLSVSPWKEAVPIDKPQSVTAANIDSATTITLFDNGEVISLPLNEYLAGVVAAEIPATFPMDAMKAQVVAARTYTMNRAALAPSTEHNGAMVCSNSAHCKAYKPITTAAASWGKNGDTYTEKINRAILDTDGEILIYDGKPISAVFFAMSSGKTERAADVWGSDIPYLQSADSAGELDLEGCVAKKDIPASEFKQKFTEKYPSAAFGDDSAAWISDITRSDAGGVMTLKVGGISIKGTDLRMLFALRSTNFSVSSTPETITFETRGYGHGVGMSQYGARLLAEDGKNYREILSHYYKDVTFAKISK